MKNTITLGLPILVLTFFSSCEKEENLSASSGKTKLHSEEFFMFDPASPESIDGFVGSHKWTYMYDKGKLVQIDVYDYNPYTNSYYPGYKFEEYHYDSRDKLVRKIQFVGDSGIKWIHKYEYLANESIKITRHEYYQDASISQPDWLIIKKASSSLTVKYYQHNNELYSELNYEMNEKGNVISKMRSPAYSGEKTYYKYDNSPNPYNSPELGGGYEFDMEKYLSQNNVIETTNDLNGKSTRIIEYNSEGYPITIITPMHKRILTYL